jgi:hypothetical protein
MSVSIRIANTLHADAKHHAKVEHRTVAAQVEFWAMLGKAALENPDLPIDFVLDLLLARAEGREHATPFIPDEFTHD